MSKRRVREKKENKQWTEKDVDGFYKNNAKRMRTQHAMAISFWRNVKYYANKTVSKNIAERAYQLHRERFQKASKLI